MTHPAVGRGESAQGREAFRARRSSPSAAAPLSAPATRLLNILRMYATAAAPITQLHAGQLLGLRGADDTIRRKVQHLRDQINDSGRAFVCSSWGSPPGMWLAEGVEQIDVYIAGVLARAYATIGQFKGLDSARRESIVREVQGVLGLQADDDEAAGADKCVHASAEGFCAWCGTPMERERWWQRFCSYECRQRWHGRKSP